MHDDKGDALWVWNEYVNGTEAAPVGGSITHKSMQGTERARMMAERLCKLALCVSGIQMALSLCVLCSLSRRRIKELREMEARAGGL